MTVQNRVQRVAGAIGLGLLAVSILFNPAELWACACGCGVFDVGVGSMMATGEGGFAYVEYDTMDQSTNWKGGSSAPKDNNGDKQILTNFYTLGLRYMVNHQWGYHVQVPYWERSFKKADDTTGEISRVNYNGVGDIRIEGMYTGLSEDMSTGLTFGLKLPTGDYKQKKDFVDRDTQIGSGSTDLLLGAYHLGALTKDNRWTWFVQTKLQNAFAVQEDYYPGSEWHSAAGIYLNGGGVSVFSSFSPVIQLKVSNRMPDAGSAAAVDANGGPASGYTRAFVAPGVAMNVKALTIYVEVAVPVYTYTIGNQLVADQLYKVVVGYNF